MCVSWKGNKRDKWEHQQWRVWKYPIYYRERKYLQQYIGVIAYSYIFCDKN